MKAWGNMDKSNGRFKIKPGLVYASVEEENRRLDELYHLQLLDTSKDSSFDRITKTVAGVFDVPICLISLITEDRQWFKSSFGLPSDISETRREDSLCQHVIVDKRDLVIEDIEEMSLSADIKENPNNIRFYAGTPLLSKRGNVLGTLCIQDVKPRLFPEEKLELLRSLGKWAMSEIELRNELISAKRREDFMKVFFQTTANGALGFNEKIVQLLKLGCDHLGYHSGGVVTLDRDKAVIIEAMGEDPFEKNVAYPLDEVFYNRLSTQDEPVHYHRGLEGEDLNDILGDILPFEEMMFSRMTINHKKADFIFFYSYETTGYNGEDDFELFRILSQWIRNEFQGVINRRKLQESETKYRMVIESANDAIILANEKSIILSWNKAAENIFGYTSDEVIGKNIDLIIPDRYLPLHRKGIQHYNQKKKAKVIGKTVEIEAKRKNGHTFEIDLSLYTWNTVEGLYFGCMVRDITERKCDQELIRELAYYDSLTGLPNRTSFNEKVEKCLKIAEPFAVLFIDMDGFKEINDKFGHTMGDLMLQAIAERLDHTLNSDKITAYRFGGDEFLVIVEKEGLEGIRKLGNLIATALSKAFTLQREQTFVSASIGISLFPEHGSDINTLLKSADSAMYKVKQHGGNNIGIKKATTRDTRH